MVPLPESVLEYSFVVFTPKETTAFDPDGDLDDAQYRHDGESNPHAGRDGLGTHRYDFGSRIITKTFNEIFNNRVGGG
jgi:hypothetical protein